MKTSVNFSKEDLKNAFKLHYNSMYPIRSRLMLFVGLLLWLVGMFLIFKSYPKEYPFLKYLIALSGVFYVAMYYYRRKKLFERASNQSSFKGSFTFEVNKKGIVFGKDNKVSECSWSDITGIIKDEKTILFYFGKDKFYILPLSTLDTVQKSAMIELVKEQNIAINEK